MAKSGKHKRLRRQEKNKVKLKGRKLPKGQNVTDVSFKSKKILIREQLNAETKAEPVTKKRLSLKELLTQLKHHNSNIQTNSLEGLQDLFVSNPELIRLNLSAILNSLGCLATTRESDVRKKGINTLKQALSLVTREEIDPFTNILSANLSCAMSHISANIRADSLLLFDVVAELYPHILVDRSDHILSNFCELISQQQQSHKAKDPTLQSRLLTVDPKFKLENVKWQLKVMTRLSNFMKALLIGRSASEGLQLSEAVQVTYNQSSGCIVVPGLVSVDVQNRFKPSITIGELSSCGLFSEKDSWTDEKSLEKKVVCLMPLLFDAWIEASPSADGALYEDTALLLDAILELISSIWTFIHICEQESGSRNLSETFKRKYSEGFKQHFLSQFPFSDMISNRKTSPGQSKGEGHQDRKIGHQRQTPSTDRSMVGQNLTICQICCSLNLTADRSVLEQIITFVAGLGESCSMSAKDLNAQISILFKILEANQNLSKVWIGRMLSCLIRITQCAEASETDRLTSANLLIDIVIRSEQTRTNIHKSPELHRWFDALCQSIIHDGQSLSTVNLEAMLKLFQRNSIQFRKSFETASSRILKKLDEDWDQLPACVQAGLRKIMFYALRWDVDVLHEVQRHGWRQPLQNMMEVEVES